MQLTAAQKDKLTAMGIDWNNVDWRKIGSLFQLFLQFLLSQQTMQAAKGKALESCCHKDCCLQSLQASLEAAAAAAHCYQSCCDEECADPADPTA